MAVARVLLVEPNDHLRRVFRRRFVREGFELVEAVDGEGALGVARRGVPDVIVVEGSVRDAAGLDLPGLLSRDPELRSVPLIVLEGRERPGLPIHPSPEAEVARHVAAPPIATRRHAAQPASIHAESADHGRLPEIAYASPELAAPAELDGRPLAPLLKELRHPFRPGRLVELARGVIASDADPAGAG